MGMPEALRKGLLTFEESALLMRRFDEGLSGYTYLEEEAPAPRITNGGNGLKETGRDPAITPPAAAPSPPAPTSPPARTRR